MEQVNSHYVPAEKPYAVYAFVWEESTTSIGQLIGTMLVGKQDEKGEMKFDGKAVYRMPSRHRMLDFEHCFIPDDMSEITIGPMFLGFQGDTVGLKEIAKVKWLDLCASESEIMPSYIAECLQMSGMKVEIPEKMDLGMLAGSFDKGYNNRTDGIDYYLAVKEGAPIRVQIWRSEGVSESVRYAIDSLYSQIKNWQDMGVRIDGIKMSDEDEKYQPQVDELLELAQWYSRNIDEKGNPSDLLACREVLGTGRCLYDDFVKAMYKVHYDGYKRVDRDLEWAVGKGLIHREGNILQFSPDIEYAASWKWEWKGEPGE